MLAADSAFLSRAIPGGNEPRIANVAIATAANSARVDNVVDQLWPITIAAWALVWVVTV